MLVAWDTPAQSGLACAIDAPRRVLASKHPASKGVASQTFRPDIKHATVLALLRRPKGAGWALHTVRGFLAGLGHEGIVVTVLERGRRAGPNKAGAKKQRQHLSHCRGRLMLASRTGSPRYAVGLTRVSTAKKGQGGVSL